MDNLSLYNRALAELPTLQQECFAHFFIGALSNLVSEVVWEQALTQANRAIEATCPDESEAGIG